MEQEEKKERRIGKFLAVFLVVCAALVDLLQAGLIAAAGIGLILNSLLTIFVGLSFWLIFRLNGVDYISDPKRFITNFAMIIGEEIPALNGLPIFTVGIALTIIFATLEDGVDIKIPGLGAVMTVAKVLPIPQAKLLSVASKALSTASKVAPKAGKLLSGAKTLSSGGVNKLNPATGVASVSSELPKRNPMTDIVAKKDSSDFLDRGEDLFDKVGKEAQEARQRQKERDDDINYHFENAKRNQEIFGWSDEKTAQVANKNYMDASKKYN